MQTCAAAAMVALSVPQEARHDLPGWRSAPGGYSGHLLGAPMTARKKATRKKTTRKKRARKSPPRSKQAARQRAPGSLKAERVARPGGGKPVVVIDPDSLRILSKRLVPEREMAAALGVSRSTLEKKIAESDELREAVYVGRCQVKDDLRTTQLYVALGEKKELRGGRVVYRVRPDPGMLKYLGYVVLGQRKPREDDAPEPEEELTAILTTKVMEFAAKACRERERQQREATKEE